jgi:plastocyanin
MKNLKLITGLIALALIVGIASWYGYDLIFKKAEPIVRQPVKQFDISPTPQVKIPTLSPEKKEIISKLETHQVDITDRAFSPASLTIKLHDQVQWQNKGNEACQIKGEGWESPTVESGTNFTQAFDQLGTFSYFCALRPEVKGTVIVQE